MQVREKIILMAAGKWGSKEEEETEENRGEEGLGPPYAL